MSAQQILKQYWGYDSFRPLQEEIVTSVLSKNDTLALLPTGGGKSVCFQVPAMVMDGICIVVSPLIALMKDQVENLQKKGINAMAIISGMGKREIDIALDNCIYGPVKFLYISPERLMTDLVKERVKYMKVNLIAVDEAHCISQWGYDFRPPYMHIKELRDIHPKVPIIALTASATDKVQYDIIEKLDLKNTKIFKKSFERTNLSYAVLNLENKLKKLINVCESVKGSGIVYVRTRKDTVEIAKYLNQHRISASYYHAGLDSESRNRTQKAWLDGSLRIIVATNAFGMGIDKPDVRFVLHYEMPESLEAYYQEAGRAGRDEQKSYAVLLYQEADRLGFEKKFRQSFPPVEEIRKTYHFLCNYLQIPLGSGEDVAYDFNIGDFCSKFQLDIITTISVIKTLEHNEYVVLSENALLPSRVQFLINGEDLYKFQVENFKYDAFIKAVLRTYGGAFDQFVSVKESDIATRIHSTRLEVIKMFEELNSQEVVSYIRKTDQPLLTFLKPRYTTENLYIDIKYYQDRKDIYQLKMNAMLAYAEQPICRSVQLLSYFDEQNVKECGVCDVCINKKKKAADTEYLFVEILEMLKDKSLVLTDLISALKKGSEEDKLTALRILMDAGRIKKSGELYHL